MSVTRDLYSDLGVTQLKDPVVVTADFNSASIDTQNFESLMLAASIGLSGDTLSGSVKIEMEVEESVDDSVWTDVANADLMQFVTGTNVGTFALIDAAAEDETVYITGYKGSKRYVRVVGNVTGTHTNGTPIGVVALRGDPHVGPVNAAT